MSAYINGMRTRESKRSGTNGVVSDALFSAPVYRAVEEFGCKEDLDCDTITHSKCLVDEGLCDYRPEYPGTYPSKAFFPKNLNKVFS